MAKRGATTDLNHDNWDDPIEDEEAGSFMSASQETLQKRVIKTARRRIKHSESSDTAKNIFASFTEFKPTVSSNQSTGAKPFSFGTNASSTSSSTATPTTNGTSTATTPELTYLSNLKQLNHSVSNWIKSHVDSNPICILTPVFNDYEKHLKQIKSERDASQKSTATLTPSLSSSASNQFTINIPTSDNSKKTFMFTDTNVKNNASPPSQLFGSSQETGKSPLQAGEAKPAVPSIFSSFKCETTGSSLMTKPDPSALMVNPFLSVIKKDDKAETKPLSFSNGSTPTSSSSNKEEEQEESDEPPKVEFTPVQEEGSVFSTRCKVFVKKDNNYTERGVGTLFIKKVGEEKHQLLVRAETVLGKILVNVLLSSGIPTQRMGKNNVMLVCLPTPEDLPPPTTVLLRVKTPAEADDLLKTIDQYKH